MSPLLEERDLGRALLADLEQIEDNARLYRAGRHSAYQAVAIQLRNLLLRGRRGLLLRVLPSATLHALEHSHFDNEPDDPKELTVFRLEPRGALELGGPGGAQLRIHFEDELLPVEAWLDQWIIDKGIRLRDLIERTADEEVAHTQDRIDDLIRKATAVKFGGRSTGREMHHMAIVALGEYVARRTRDMLAGQ